MIVAVSDFNMGAMENKGLNIFNDKYVLASARDRDRRRLRQHRGDHRARIFPQLDRQPHHLPRLVPALPQGRPDRLPRSGIHRPTSARGRSSASATCARCARINSPRMPVRSPIRCGPTLYHEINNFYTATVYEKGAEVVRMLQDAARRRQHSARAWTSISSATTARRRRSRSSCRASPMRAGATSSQFMLLVRAGRHARGRRHRHATTRARKTYRLDLAQTLPPTPGQPAKEPMADPARARPRRAGRRATCRCSCRRRPRSSAACSPSTRPARQLRLRRRRRSRRCRRSSAASRRRSSSSPIVGDDDLRFLAAHDSDPFNRWQAVQTLATRLLVDNVAGDPARRAAATWTRL